MAGSRSAAARESTLKPTSMRMPRVARRSGEAMRLTGYTGVAFAHTRRFPAPHGSDVAEVSGCKAVTATRRTASAPCNVLGDIQIAGARRDQAAPELGACETCCRASGKRG